jgi:hypothetical protein
MASITINGINAKAQDAFATVENGYTGFLSDGVTPQTQIEFIKAFLINVLGQEVASRAAKKAAKTAADLAIVDSQANVILS